MQMYISGSWTDSRKQTAVLNPNTGETIDCVPSATAVQVEMALAAAVKGAAAMAALSGDERAQILNRTAQLLEQNAEDMAQTITLEEGKPLTEARAEVTRMPDLLRLSAFEGTQVRGETLPIDAHPGAKGKIGLTLRVPCGVVLAITPFNYPLVLVMHKVAPALAAGNSVLLKPADKTPLTALKLTKLLLEAGLPENGIQCITGEGSRIGPLLCADARVRKISFTGSSAVGLQISQVAGIKRLSLELGSNSPLVVLEDADLDRVVESTAVSGFVNAGQACISTQRVLVHQRVYGDFLDGLKSRVEAIKVGDPMAPDTKLSAMVSEKEAARVESWVREAVGQGARLITGGERQGAVFAPTIVADVSSKMRISCEELFGPAVGVTAIRNIDEAIALANDTPYGLSAGLFTKDLNNAFHFARSVHSGNVMINWSPLWRADLMPYGGFKQSGIGKEGPRYAVQEMTDVKTVVFHGLSN